MISAYLGFALAAAAVVEYLLRLPIGRAAFGTRNHDLAVGTGAAVSIIAVALAGEPLWPAVASGVLAAGWFAVTKTQLKLPFEPMTVEAGAPVPRFAAARTDGSPFGNAELAAAAPALLIVYRGKW